ncbi:hypothetical protein H8S95_07245 [Pontibacter sp. KCTC 32443]|uniref:DUF6702 family protein n=1 Tax=Pontibacter TaxID=323449 RepID=UPI00164D4B8B|nr:MULTISPECIES: DUF6702 family protein [Pontibacter]MBC5773853.1 hypothetical protein [Pontibacter sp. KCTC 32443]
MNLKSFIVAILCLFSSTAAMAHDYHSSITDIKFNPRTQSLQVAIKVFTDDLETVLTKRSKSKVTYSANSESIKQQLAGYMAAAMSFEVTKGKPLKQRFVGSEEEADVVWVYLEVPVQNTSLSQLYIKNAVLTELFDDQMNIVNLDYKGNMHSMLLQKDETAKKLTF